MSTVRRQDRKSAVLDAARDILLEEGFYGLSMERIARESGYPKGTIYQQFGCKEDVLITLALEYLSERMEIIERAVAYPGRAREKLGAVGEGIALFVRLNPDKSSIIHMAAGTVREKAGASRIRRLMDREQKLVAIMRSLLQQGVDDGDLRFHDDDSIERMTFALWATVDGAYTLIENGVPQNALKLQMPVYDLWMIYNLLADAWGFRPFYHEHDWEETMADIRRTIFPEEAQQLYGKGCWYGDRGPVHPSKMAIQDGSAPLADRTAFYYSLNAEQEHRTGGPQS